jgi:hypothetical protein
MNELLTWMSAQQAGSLLGFRGRVAELYPTVGRSGHAMPSYRLAAWTLSKLGHAEFENAASGAGWRVAPPVFAAGDIFELPRAVLCGARTSKLLQGLADRGGTCRIKHSSVASTPDLIEIEAESFNSLVAIADDVGVPVQWNASLALLSACTYVKGTVLQECSIPVGAGWTVSRFSKSGLCWVSASLAEPKSVRNGFFRFRGDYGTNYVLKENGDAFSCHPTIGKYRILARRNRPLRYSAAAQELTVAASCRPPEVIERALVVASGRLPNFQDKALVYKQVSRTTAETVANLLGQRLH